MTEPNAKPWADLAAYRAEHARRNPVPDVGQVVAGLAERKQWLIWRYEPGETPDKKPRKMPYYVGKKRRHDVQGSEQDRAGLETYAVAAADAIKRGFDGVGFAFLPGDGLIGIDLDGMIDPDTGEISDRCSEIIKACDSYTEVSPSGKGVHIICSGETETFKSNKVGIEVFAGRQYFTFTAKPWPGAPHEVRALNESALRRLRATVKGSKAAVAPAGAPAPSVPTAPPTAQGGRQRSLAESVALAEEALQHLDPDDYQQWIDVGLACKAGLGTAGYYVWDAWSARSGKYAGDEDTRKRWAGFKPTQLTLGTVFGLAEAAGWVSPWAKARAKKPRRAPPAAGVSEPAAASPSPQPAPPAAAGGTPPPPYQAPARGGDEPPPDRGWELQLLRKKGEISTCLANAELILSHMPSWKGVIGYDEFAEKTVHRAKPPCSREGAAEGDWSDHLDMMAAIWMQRAWNVEFSPTTVGQAVEVLARQHRFHPVREALKALLPWDGTRRNSEWLSDYLGVERTEYTALVGQFFLRGMIKRVMEPGCKFDYCLVLEGDQGKGKSTVARILAWHWFCDTDLDLNNKDSMLSLPGHWVYEIAEMGSLMKAEEKKQKSFLSRQEDEYRPPYGKRLIKVPRQSVFIGTTNEEEYLKDATGGRRFWPVLCQGDFDLAGLRDNIEQMLAEALADYYAGERCWPSREEDPLFVAEQAKRGMPEPFEDLLYTYVKNQLGPFSMADAAVDGLKLTADKLTPATVTRIGIALKRLRCVRKEDRNAVDPGQRRMYMSPAVAKQEALQGSQYAGSEGDDDDDLPL